jgi:hypothetical protein
MLDCRYLSRGATFDKGVSADQTAVWRQGDARTRDAVTTNADRGDGVSARF